MDKLDYHNRIHKLVTEGPYIELTTNPLPKMIQQIKDVIKVACQTLGSEFKWKLNESNPTIPRMYALPKIHKPGNSMRPIISNVNAPHYKISKYVVNEIRQLQPIEGFYVKNSLEFVERVRNVIIEENEMMVSFDIKAMFDNIPIEKALVHFKKWLEPQMSNEKCDLLMKIVKISMEQNCFKVNDKFYKQQKGTAMGNPLSPDVANIFVSFIEKEMSKDPVFPKVWIR